MFSLMNENGNRSNWLRQQNFKKKDTAWVFNEWAYKKYSSDLIEIVQDCIEWRPWDRPSATQLLRNISDCIATLDDQDVSQYLQLAKQSLLEGRFSICFLW